MTRLTAWEKVEYVIFVVLCIGYMGLYVMIMQGEKGGGLVATALMKEGLVIWLVLLFLFCFSKRFIDFAKDKFTWIAYLTIGVSAIYCLLVFAENQLESVCFLKGTEIKLWYICINKSLIFNGLVLMIPLFVIMIRSFLEEDSSLKSKLLAGYIVLSNSIMIVFLFIDQWNTNPYVFELIFLLWLSVCWLVICVAKCDKYIYIDLNRSEIMKAIVIMATYSLFIFCLIKVGTFIFEKKFIADYSLNFDMLVNCFKGNSRWLVAKVSNEYDTSYFTNPIYYIVIRGNRVLLAVYLFSICLFLEISWKYLGVKYGKYKTLQPVYNGAFYLLFIKIVAGTCYGLGLSSWKVNLPFCGTADDILCDIIITVLLFLSSRQNNNSIRERKCANR